MDDTLQVRGTNLLSKGKQRKPTYQVMDDIAKGMSAQSKSLGLEFQSINKSLDDLIQITGSSTTMDERIHDRLEAIALEQRTTNILLAKLVALHESVVVERNGAQIQNKSEGIRMDAYGRVLRGE